MKPLRVQIITQASSQLGYGHLRRCMSLANYLNLQGDQCAIRLRIGEADLVPQKWQTQIDNPNVYFLDMHDDVVDLTRLAHEQGKPCIVLDNFLQDFRTASINVFNHSASASKAAIFAGYEYAIIREEILNVRNQVREGEETLVSIGGADVMGLSIKVADELLSQGQKPLVVLGPLAKVMTEGRPYPVLRKPENYPNLMAQCGRAISNAGGTLFELLFLGKSVVVVPQSEREMRIAQDLLERKMILGINDLSKMRWPHDLKPSIFDGKGLERIRQVILSQVGSLI